MWQSAVLRFAAEHPAAAGHFPENPIIPGAVLLDQVLARILCARDGARDGAVTLRAAKFLQVVRPGDSLDLRWQSSGDNLVAFEAYLTGRGLAVSGRIETGEPPS